MKTLLLLLITGLAHADQLININGVPTNLMPSVAQGTASSTDTATYALNGVTPTVRSSGVDTAGWAGIFIHVTSSSQPLIGVEFSPTNVAASYKRAYTLQGEGSASLRNLNRWVRFTNLNPSQLGLTGTTTSLSYLPVQLPSATVSGTITVAGTVTANQGSAGTQNWPVVQTSTASALGVSNTTRALTAALGINVTSTGGVNAKCTVCFGGVGNSTVGFYWRFMPSVTWPTNSAMYYYAISTTPICRTGLAPGVHLDLSPSSATDISTTVIVDIESETVRQ